MQLFLSAKAYYKLFPFRLLRFNTLLDVFIFF